MIRRTPKSTRTATLFPSTLLFRSVLAAGTGPALRRLGDKRHGTVEPDGEHIVALGQRAVGGAVLHVGAVAPDAGGDRLAVFGVRPDLARQREEDRKSTRLNSSH